MLRLDVETQLRAFRLRVALEVPAGRCLALAGPSGAGKSTVLRIVAGLLAPDRGTVAAGPVVLLDTAAGVDLPPERRGCGVVFQDYALFPHLSVWQNVAYPLRRLPRAERRARALELLARFGIEAVADQRPASLSGGQRQRVAVARALASEPRVVLLDEPLSALDPRTRAGAARELLAALRAVDVPAVLVTHDFAEAATLGDRVAVIDDGRVVQVGTPDELAARPANAFVADFTGAVVLTGRASPGPAGLTAVDLDGGGGQLLSTDAMHGPVAVTVHPWEIVVAPPDHRPGASTPGRIPARVLSVTTVGGRVRLGLDAGQPLAAEITTAAARDLDLTPGAELVATFEASTTRLVRG